MGNMAKTSRKREKVVVVVKETKPIPFWLVFFIFLATTFIFFYDQILMNSFFWEDFVEYVFPVQSYAAKAFSRGQIPFWNPYTFAGMPFLADIQVGFFYVFNRLLSLFTLTGNNLPVLALELIIIFDVSCGAYYSSNDCLSFGVVAFSFVSVFKVLR
jgi:hypothetical protein